MSQDGSHTSLAPAPAKTIGAVRPWPLDLSQPCSRGHASGTLADVGEARALVVYFDSLRIPYRDTLFILDLQGRPLWHFTARETRTGGPTATPLLFTGSLRWTYSRHPLTRDHALVRIGGLGVVPDPGPQGQPGQESLLSCLINVNSSPEGDDWQDEKNGIVRILLRKGASLVLATGALMNNTSLDNTPYVLTSDNCANGATAADLLQTVFYFGDELPDSSISGTPLPLGSITGATFVARGGVSCNLHSDFYLVRLNQPLPQSLQPYLLGYDRSGAVEDSVVCIHHSGGLFKQIATSWGSIVPSTYFGGVVYSHWKAWWSATAHGLGVTDNGANGAPLLSAAGRVIGVWSEGYSSCSGPAAPDYFGKLSLSWQQYLSTPATRLKEWLDPGNTGAMTLDGMYPTAYPPEAAFSLASSSIQSGDSLLVVDVSLGAPAAWNWQFPGGQPSLWNGSQPPAIHYPSPGTYDIGLIVTNSSGSDTLLIPGAVKVYPADPTVITSLDTLTVCADTVEVIVRVSNLYHVRNGALTLSIDTASLHFLGAASLHPRLQALNPGLSVQGSDLWITWSSTQPFHVGDDTLATLRFEAAQGTHALTWNTTRPWMCQYYAENMQPLPTLFRPGLLDAQSCGTLSGTLRYAGTSLGVSPAALSFTDVYGRQYSTTVRTDGSFILRRVIPSQGQVTVLPGLPWSDGNASDALLILRHFAKLDTLNGLAALAGDANGSGSVNTTDALLVAQRFAQLIPSFPASDWITAETAVIIGPGFQSLSLEAILRGDVNRSWGGKQALE